MRKWSLNILFANNLRGFYGGVEQVLLDYARGLTERGHRSFLAYGIDGRDPEEFARAFDDTFRCSEFGSDGGDTASTGQRFDAIVGEVEPEVVFFHKVTHLPHEIERNDGVRKVVMVHDHDLWCPTGLGYHRGSRRICRHPAGWRCYMNLAFLERGGESRFPIRVASVGKKLREMKRYHRFDAILANSSYTRNRLLYNGFPREKTRVCFPVLRQPEVSSVPIPTEPNVLYAGSLIRGKGVDLLLRAFGLLNPAAQLHIVGVGKSEGALKRLSRTLGIEKRVHFAGWVDHEELANYYARARVVAVPSCWPEPFGLVGMEAMRHGRPVVAFEVGGIPDWLEHEGTGLLVAEQDVAGFAASLERLLDDSGSAEQMGAYGRERAAAAFAFEDNVALVEKALTG